MSRWKNVLGDFWPGMEQNGDFEDERRKLFFFGKFESNTTTYSIKKNK